jgi:hypothetical protein
MERIVFELSNIAAATAVDISAETVERAVDELAFEDLLVIVISAEPMETLGIGVDLSFESVVLL